jgi:hypothetical protein
LIDYGEAWEQAWQTHVHQFVPRKHYIATYELNKMLDLIYHMEDEPALEGVVLWCHSKFIKLFVDCKDSE